MRLSVTDRVALSVGLFVTVVSPPKTAEPIEISFWAVNSGGPKERRIRWDGSSDPPYEGAIVGGMGGPL